MTALPPVPRHPNSHHRDEMPHAADLSGERSSGRLTDQTTATEAAWLAAEAVRALNRHTLFPGDQRGYRFPADVDAVIGALIVLTQRLPQALQQAARWLQAEHAAERIGHDQRPWIRPARTTWAEDTTAAESLGTGDVEMPIVMADLQAAFDRAEQAAAPLAFTLRDARSVSCHLTAPATGADDADDADAAANGRRR